MNPRALDLTIRSVTTALLALGFLVIVGVDMAKTGTIDPALLALAGPVFGVFVGAHVSQNGASARSRAEALAVESVTGVPAPRDPLSQPLRPPNGDT